MKSEFERVKEQIQLYDAVSFDIFDTLLMRKTLYPEDVFEIVAHKAEKLGIHVSDFRLRRIEAVLNNTHPNPNIYEIYQKMEDDCYVSKEESRKLLELEVAAERSMAVCREEIKQLFDLAVEQNKCVSLITDMYLPAELIREMLTQIGITKNFNLFVSCEFRTLKTEQLFRIYKEQVPAEKYLHIGDNMISDIQAANRNEIDTVHIKSAFQAFQQSRYCDLLKNAESLNGRSALGLIISRLYNSPFCSCCEKNIWQMSDIKDLGFIFWGSIVTKFMLWLFQQVKERYYDGILFCARDGYLFHELYEWSLSRIDGQQFPEGIYFLTSRAVCTSANVKNRNDLIWLTDVEFDGTEEAFLVKRLSLDREHADEYKNQKDCSLREYVLKHAEEIYMKSQEIKDGYLKYMGLLNLKREGKYAFFDFVSSGTCQYFLSKIVSFDIRGMYFCRIITQEERKNELIIDSMLTYPCGKQYHFLDNYQYAETIMSSRQPSLRSFEAEGTPVYNEEVRDGKQIEAMEQMQLGIKEFYKEYMDNLLVDDKTMTIEFADQVYGYFRDEVLENMNFVQEMELTDDWVFRRYKVSR